MSNGLIKRIAVVGSGTMGNGIAHCFAQFGYQVNLVDVNTEAIQKGLTTIAGNLDRQISKGSVAESDKSLIMSRIKPFLILKEGVKDADLVIEAASENEGIKRQIFRELSSFCKRGAILASNTSSISISTLAGVTNRPENVIGMHFMNPVPVMKLVEVITTHSTSAETTQTIMDLSVKLDKIPVEVKDYPGFVANRILMPMINEAIYTLHEGVAGVYEIDTVMKLGMSHPMGPLQLADFIGLDVCLAIMNVLHTGFQNPKYAPCPLLLEMVNSGHLGKKSGKGFYDY